jgi:hypothetical protein
MNTQTQQKTPWRKNLDKRYISGEDLKQGIEMNKGLRPEMVVTIAKFHDAPAFDSKLQKEVDKTAIWLKEYPSGKMLYKPCLLNVKRGSFLSKELGNGSMFIEDFSTETPFVVYAQPDPRHGFIVAFKKYYPPATVSDTEALLTLERCTSLAGLQETWLTLSVDERKLPSVLAKKESLKTILK